MFRRLGVRSNSKTFIKERSSNRQDLRQFKNRRRNGASTKNKTQIETYKRKEKSAKTINNSASLVKRLTFNQTLKNTEIPANKLVEIRPPPRTLMFPCRKEFKSMFRAGFKRLTKTCQAHVFPWSLDPYHPRSFRRHKCHNAFRRL